MKCVYLCSQTCWQRDSNGYTYVFGVGYTNGTCIYTVRLNWEETGSGKSKMAAYAHEMRMSQLPDLLATRFQRQYLCFRGQLYQLVIYTVRLNWGNRKWKIKDFIMHPWNAYIPAIRLNRIWYHAKVPQRVHSIMCRTWNQFFNLTEAVLDFFRLRLTSDNIPLSAIELFILENMVNAFRISILSCLHAEIHAFPV